MSDLPEDPLKPQDQALVRHVRLITGFAALVLMAGIGTLLAIVIHKMVLSGENRAAAPARQEVAVSLDGRIIAASAANGALTVVTEAQTIIIIDLESGKETRRLHFKAP